MGPETVRLFAAIGFQTSSTPLCEGIASHLRASRELAGGVGDPLRVF
jgi:hypothetical protein